MVLYIFSNDRYGTMKSILYCIACLTLYYSCEKIEHLALPGPSMVGAWIETEPDGIHQFEGSTWKSLKLNEDSTFQIAYTTWTDIINTGDPCNAVTNFYIKGAYSLTSDSIFFHGCYSDSVHGACVAKCDGSTDFTESYKYSFEPDLLVINPERDELVKRVMVPDRG